MRKLNLMTDEEVTQGKKSSGAHSLCCELTCVRGSDEYRWDPLEQEEVQLQ